MLTIFYDTSTGKTEEIVQCLMPLVGYPTELRDIASLSSEQDFCSAAAMICCVPTWYTGADSFRSGTAWDSYVEAIPELNLTGKPVAILGLGDSSSYSDYVCDAMEELHSAFQQAGARMLGSVPRTGSVPGLPN